MRCGFADVLQLIKSDEVHRPLHNVDESHGCSSPEDEPTAQRHRVVIRKPMNMIPNPIRMFQLPSEGMGHACWLK